MILGYFCAAGLDISFLSLQKLYKQKFEKEKGKSIYNNMVVPPDVQHAMDVAKSQSNVSHFHSRATIKFDWFNSQHTISIIGLFHVTWSVSGTHYILSPLFLNTIGCLQEGC